MNSLSLRKPRVRSAAWRRFALGALIVPMLWTACSKAPVTPANVVAQVGDRAITIDEVRHEVERRRRAGMAVPDRRTVLQEMVDRESLFQQARNAGLAEDPEVQEAWKNLLIGRWKARQLEPRVESLAVSADEVRTWYEAHPDQYRLPAQSRLALLQLKKSGRLTPENRQLRRSHLDEARARALELEPSTVGFGPLAAQYSEDVATRHRGGDLGWIKDSAATPWPPEVIAAGLALPDIGAVSEVLETENGFYLVKLSDRRPTSRLPLSQVEAGLRHRLLREKRERLEAGFIVEARRTTRAEVLTERWEESDLARVTEISAMPASTPAIP